MNRPWLYGKNKVSLFFKERIFERVYKPRKDKNIKKESAVKRFFIFIGMFICFLPDFPWCLKLVVEGGVFYIVGSIMEICGLKKSGASVKLYGRNIALSIDQFVGTKAMGQDSDVSISMALGVAKLKKTMGFSVSWFWIWFGEFVDWLFWFDPDHIKGAIEKEELAEGTVIKLYQEGDKTKKAA